MTGLNLPSKRLTRRRLWLPAIVAALIAGALLGLIGFDRYSRPLFDLWQRAAPRSLEKTQVRIVWIDDASIKTIGPWPWPRYIMARLTETLVQSEPKVIGYDIIFPDPDRNTPEAFVSLYPELPPATAATIRALPSMDALFSQVLGKSQVVLARVGLDTETAETEQNLLVEAQFGAPLPPGTKSWGRVLGNLPILDDVALGHGLINGTFDRDGVIRRVPLVGKAAGKDMTGFALEMARIARGVERIDPVTGVSGLNALRFNGKLLPVAKDGTARIRFGRLPEKAIISAADLITGTVSSKIVAGKIVIVGLNAAGTSDVVGSPIDAQTYGTMVQAGAVDAILNNALIARPGWAWSVELAIAIFIMALALVVAPRLRGIQVAAIAITTTIATFLLSALAFYRYGVMIDATGPLFVGVVACATMIFRLFAHARQTLFEERLVSARATGELNAARDIQLGMLPDRQGLSAFDMHVDLDALIEPARSIGGDFYDVIRLDEHRVCFLIGDVTGKGVPAALFMALSKALSKSVLLREADDLGAAVTRLNTEIARDNSEDMFVTMLFGVLDTRDGRLDLCNAGHENPYRIDTQGAVSLINIDGGPPLCVAPGFPYEAETVMLSYGESIVIVSDGITEAQSPEGDFFGHERLAAVLNDWQASSEVSGASNALLREVRAFENGAEATDDLTVLVFRYTGPTPI
jgi:serine phosphatase RsbU (regulator of sigma subunit)/CHASE2 domain-containing sensor protein